MTLKPVTMAMIGPLGSLFFALIAASRHPREGKREGGKTQADWRCWLLHGRNAPVGGHRAPLEGEHAFRRTEQLT